MTSLPTWSAAFTQLPGMPWGALTSTNHCNIYFQCKNRACWTGLYWTYLKTPPCHLACILLLLYDCYCSRNIFQLLIHIVFRDSRSPVSFHLLLMIVNLRNLDCSESYLAASLSDCHQVSVNVYYWQKRNNNINESWVRLLKQLDRLLSVSAALKIRCINV